MKNKILTAVAVMASLCGYAQTKGTSALGFGISSQTGKIELKVPSAGTTTEESKYNSYSLNYGYFIKDNAKLGIELNYGNQDSRYVEKVSGSKSKTYGLGLNYQQYYPLIKTLYAYAGGAVNYSNTKTESGDINYADRRTDFYGVGVSGGLTWFVSKRFALETSLLSAGAYYMKNKEDGTQSNNESSRYKNTTTSFNLSSSGLINDLGFKIYILF